MSVQAQWTPYDTQAPCPPKGGISKRAAFPPSGGQGAEILQELVLSPYYLLIILKKNAKVF